MSPPTEQLIRDYLNRLSVAARSQLAPDDRRALVDRTRDFIERKTGLAGPPTAVEVARLLAGLGDPSGLVQQERLRLAAVRGEMPQPSASRNPITRALRREPGKIRGSSWHWPVMEGSRTDLQLMLLDGGKDEGATTSPAEPDWFFRAAGDQPGDAADDAQPPAGQGAEMTGEPAVAGQARPPWPLNGTAGAGVGTRAFAVDAAGAAADSDDVGRPDVAASPTISPAWQLTVPPEERFWPPVRRAARAALAWYRRRPLEASAVILLGLGGAIYPPVWVLGAALALASRLWDYRDRWIGLALPLLLTLIAIALGVAKGGHVSMGHGVHEGWVYGVVASRVTAVLGASYLGWRSVHGRRPPAVPPWNKPRKVG